MTTPSFNVLTEGWIPVVLPDGSVAETGVLDALSRAHALKGIRDPSPLIEFGLYRLLTAFVHDALTKSEHPLDDPEDLRELLSTGRFDLGLFEKYVRDCGEVFDLFHPHRPFLQSSGAEGGEKPLAALYPAVPSGTNVHHWHHADEGDMATSPAAAARLLTTLAPFMTAGGAGLSPSINGAPAVYALPTGRNLFETLVLNLPTGSRGSGDGAVVWRDKRTPGGERRQARLGEALTWRPRRVRLLPPDDKGLVSGMFFQAGDSTRVAWIDPNLAYRYDKDGTALPIRMREGRPLWRDAGPLALLHNDAGPANADKFHRPDVVAAAFGLVDDDLILRVYGMRTDMKMKVFEWATGDLKVPRTVGSYARVGLLIHEYMRLAEEAGGALRVAMKRLYPREGAGNKKALGHVIERAETAYWREMEPRFHRLLDAARVLPEDAPSHLDLIEPVAAPWKAEIRKQALSAFEQAAADFDADADALERAVTARRRLQSTLTKKLRGDLQ